MATARRINVWLLVFLALLWFGATFVYFGDTGKYSDDWCTSCRGVADGGAGIDWSLHPWATWPYFWRPLHLIHIWVVNTVLWKQDWVGHLELALVHLGVCVMLFRFLVRMGSARGAAMSAAVLLGTCPLLGEAIGWFSASCNAIGTLLMLVTLGVGHGYALRRDGGWRVLLGIALLSFATACFYEPSAAGLAVMPLVVWFASAGEAETRARVRRVVMATIAAGVPCVVYAGLLVWSAPPGERGAMGTVGDLDPGHHRVASFARSFAHMVWGARGRDAIVGGIEQAMGAAREYPLLYVVVGATVVAGVLALVAGVRARVAEVERGDGAAGGRGRLLVVGLAMVLASWVPFLAQHDQKLATRSLYVPLLGGAILVAAAGNGLLRAMGGLSVRGRGVAKLGAACVVGVIAIAGQVSLMGMQAQFRGNARHDDVVAQRLAGMAGRAEPGTSFLILRDEYSEAVTSRPSYNISVHTALRDHWAAPRFVRLFGRRNDVYAMTGNYTGRSPVCVDHLTVEGVRDTGIGSNDRTVPWENIVPVWIDARGDVHIVETLAIMPLKGEVMEIRLGRAERLAKGEPAMVRRSPGDRPRRVRLVELANRRTRVVFDAEGAVQGRGEGADEAR